MARRPFTLGLHEVGDGVHAYLQPDGGWGLSNAGLVTGGGRSLLVDTLFDLRLTRAMLDAMRPLTAAAPIRTLLNTHSDADHCWGNQLVSGAEIVASRACAEAMGALPPEGLRVLLAMAEQMPGKLGGYVRRLFGDFDFEGIALTKPTRTFEGSLTLHLGDRPVELRQMGPAHTAGDAMAYLPRDRVLFSGDVVFVEGTPIVWAGPVGRWIAALDAILALDVETIVPGHGPMTDKRGVEKMRGYLTFIRDEVRKRFEAGQDPEEAAREIYESGLGDYAGWRMPELVVVNVDRLYKEFRGDPHETETMVLFAQMAELAG